ncbi:hypothetical protein MKX03_036212 [Papaver bracteatum]|nr:hypothetical protein MKX03_036212 [Papaver bracteatum]
MEHDMHFEEDSIASSGYVQASSEVTCTDYIKKLEEEPTIHDDIEVQGHSTVELSQYSNLSAAAAPFLPNRNMQLDTYMWRVMHKRDRATPAPNLGPEHLTTNATGYFRNWSLMQSYFQWDFSLPAAKKAKITEISETDLNCNPALDSETEKEIHVIEEKMNILAYPHQWYKGESSSSNNDASGPKEKGKGIAYDH